MSEIFRWLKKTELENRRPNAESFGRAVVIAEEGQSTALGGAAPDIQEVPNVSSPISIRTDARFDLAGADSRIRDVLDPLTEVGEQYRLLRAKLSLLQKQHGLKILLVTSSVPSEGKTFTACCLAGVFAQEPGKRVLLIDADLRRPRASRELGLLGGTEVTGLSQILRGEAVPQEVMLSSNSLDFYLMPAGAVPADPAELLSSPLLEQTIAPLKADFDWIVIDSPPVLALADASLLAPLSDAVIIVVRTDKTPVKMIKEAIARLGHDKICGIVMNRGRERQSSNYYYYHYYRKSAKDRG
jgi:capsular exopolysaccharide synthesis family protein